MATIRHNYFSDDDAQSPTTHSYFDDAPAPAAQPAPTPQKPSGWESAGRGAAQGATFGLGDEIQGAIQASLPMPGDPSSWSQRYDKETGAARADNERAKAANPVAYHASEFVGGLPAAIATGGAGSAAGRVAAAGAYGGLSGFGHGEGTAGSLVGAGLGAATGAGGQAVIGEALAPWLAGKFTERARDLTLEQNGLTRNLVRKLVDREGGQEASQEQLNEIYRVIQNNADKMPGKNTQVRADQALQKAKDNIGGFYRQADQLDPHGSPLSASDILDAQANARASTASNMGDRAADHVDSEADYLWQKFIRGQLGYEDVHRNAMDIGTRVWPKGRGAPPEGVDPHMMQQYLMELQGKLRAKAIGVTPADAPITPDAFRGSVSDYQALKDLQNMSRQQSAHDKVRGVWSWLNEHALEGGLLAGGGFGAALTEHPVSSLAAGGAAALGKMAYSSPAVNRFAAEAATSPVTSGVGRQAFAGIQQAIGQPAAAAAFTAGQRPHPEDGYTPPSPLREGP